jgi:cytochrome P450
MAGTAPLVPGSILLGSAGDIRADMLGTCERAFRDFGDVVRIRVGLPRIGRELHFVFDPDGAHHVLAGNAANYRKDNVFYAEIRGVFGDGLLTSQDDDWQRQKRFLQPLFTHRRVTGYTATISEQVDSMIADWRAEPAADRDMHHEMTRLTLRVVCRLLFGNNIEQALPVVQRWFGPLGESVRRRSMAPFRLPSAWPTPVNRRLTRARQELFAVCDEIIRERRGSSAPTGQDLLGLLLDARDNGSALTDAEIRDQVLIFLLAGHETTSTALTYTLYLLGRHPSVQERVRAEPDTGYPAMVLKEAMRLFPSAPLTGRRSVTDDEISGYHIPAGSDVVVTPWVTHRHPRFWDSPAEFDPERFTPERERARHRYAWYPFGGGPRACIGQHFSMLESTIALTALVRNFDFTAPAAVPPYTNHITLRPTSTVPVRVTARRIDHPADRAVSF